MYYKRFLKDEEWVSEHFQLVGKMIIHKYKKGVVELSFYGSELVYIEINGETVEGNEKYAGLCTGSDDEIGNRISENGAREILLLAGINIK
jgi:hypothetical protein